MKLLAISKQQLEGHTLGPLEKETIWDVVTLLFRKCCLQKKLYFAVYSIWIFTMRFFFLRQELLCLSLHVKTQTNKQTFLEFVLFISRPVLQCHLGDLDGKHDWKTFKLQLRLIALDQPEYYQDWSIVKHSNVLRCVLCVVQPGGSREDACEALGALKR